MRSDLILIQCTNQYLWKTRISRNVMPILTIRYSLMAKAHAKRIVLIWHRNGAGAYWYVEYYPRIGRVVAGTWNNVDLRWSARNKYGIALILLLNVRHTIVYDYHDKRSPNATDQRVNKTDKQPSFLSWICIEDWLLLTVDLTWTVETVIVRLE